MNGIYFVLSWSIPDTMRNYREVHCICYELLLGILVINNTNGCYLINIEVTNLITNLTNYTLDKPPFRMNILSRKNLKEKLIIIDIILISFYFSSKHHSDFKIKKYKAI